MRRYSKREKKRDSRLSRLWKLNRINIENPKDPFRRTGLFLWSDRDSLRSRSSLFLAKNPLR
jgi:hypothetical protein